MTQSKTGAFPTGRIPQLIGKAALAASVVVGSVALLGAGQVQAEVICLSFPCTSGVYTVESLGSSFTSPYTGTVVTSIDNPVGGSSVTGTVDTDFTGPNLVGINSGEIWYKVTKADGPITAARIDSDFDTTPGSVQKQIYAEFAAGVFSGLLYDATSSNGMPTDFAPLSTALNTIYVKDIFTVGDGGQLDNFTNTFVPGPLPILGAGAAFGFSRKLRSRIKAARLS
ncbi:MAG: hypothetical protein ACKOYH_10405 [Cyanobium sp.]